MNDVVCPAARNVIFALPEARPVSGAMIDIVRARRLNVARASDSFVARALDAAGGSGGGVTQYGALPV